MNVLNVIILFILVIYIIYFVLSYVPLILKKKDIIKKSSILNKYLILVPCRNESNVIKRIIKSINNQSYNKDYYDYVLLINNTSDDTIDICNKNKYNYIVINNCNNKGDVLRYAFNYYKDKDYIGYIIFDADNVLDINFISSMNDYYNYNKCDVIQGYRKGLNARYNYLTGCYELYYVIQNIGYNELKIKQNLNAASNGTGFFISKEYISKYGFNTKTNTEDVELNILLSLNNKRIGYSELSITNDEYVKDFKTSIIQRKRWSRGMLDSFKYIKCLFIDFIKNKNLNSIDNICILLGTFINFPVALNLIILSIYNIKLSLLVIILIYIMVLLFTILLVLRSKVKIKLSSILFFPIFLMSFFYVQLISIIKKDNNWNQIKHGNECNIMNRCKWCNLNNPKYIEYHDNEWCRFNKDDKYLYEMLVLESFQSGLSWECILNKRDEFKKAYDNFDIDKVCNYDSKKINELLNNKKIIRNKLKINASINNSKIFKDIVNEYGSFYNYLIRFTNDKIIYEFDKTSNELSDKISKDLQKRGMKFVGSITIYSYLQAIGIIYSHSKECYLYKNN